RYKRTDAIRFAFLMAIPTLKGATVLKAHAFLGLQTFEEVSLIFFAVLVSFVIGFCVIHLLMRSLNTALLRFLGLYRVLLGTLILGGLYFWNWF
ncbi:MAG: undecaprenyl-diphosphate phosphatase, partial [Holosporaceae bacterium]